MLILGHQPLLSPKLHPKHENKCHKKYKQGKTANKPVDSKALKAYDSCEMLTEKNE